MSSQGRVRTSKSSGNVEVNIVNKHDRRHWQKSYPSATSVKTVREEAAAHFRIPFEVAVWNCTAIDDEQLKDLGVNTVELEIENILGIVLDFWSKIKFFPPHRGAYQPVLFSKVARETGYFPFFGFFPFYGHFFAKYPMFDTSSCIKWWNVTFRSR